MPLCVATAGFVAGPIRSRIGVNGIASAETRNLNNDCPYFRMKILETPKIRDLKEWVRSDLDGTEGKLEDYSVEEEGRRVKELAEFRTGYIYREAVEAEAPTGYEDGASTDLRGEYGDPDSEGEEGDQASREDGGDDGTSD